MNGGKRLISYPEERALEDAAFVQAAAPTRIFAILLPVWCVEVKAKVTDGEPYELIDRYLERGIAEAGLDTVASLAGFFGLDEILVDRALRFLGAIGHVTQSDGRLGLTELGYRSVRDQVRYVVTRQDRRKMYFDAFGSRPLTRPYYDARTVTLLSASEANAAADRRDGPRFRSLCSLRSFRAEALTELARNSERDRFNLPERIDNPESLGTPECVFLPMYIVRAVHRGNRRLLAYTQAGDGADPYISELCEKTPEIDSVIETEDSSSRSGFYEKASQWLERAELGKHSPVLLDDGTWRVTLPGSSFGGEGPLRISKIGSFVVLGNDILYVWCNDEKARRRGLLERINAYLGSRARIDRDDVEARISQIARQLKLGAIHVPELHRMAVAAGRTGLAAQLGRLL
jgi:hypothetical protein